MSIVRPLAVVFAAVFAPILEAGVSAISVLEIAEALVEVCATFSTVCGVAVAECTLCNGFGIDCEGLACRFGACCLLVICFDE
mgnify:CR=1 FL=1